MKKISPYVSFPLVFVALCTTLALLYVLSSAPDISPADPAVPEAVPTREGTLGIGQTLALEGMTVTLHRVVADSRCPADVQCIWAGNAVAEVTLQNGTLRETLTMASGETPRLFGTYRISIVDVAPPALSTAPIDAQAYRITFRTEPMTETGYVEAYLRANISTLSPEPAVLGGTFYVTEVVFPETGKALVSYEDGHVAFVADVAYELSADNAVTVRAFTVRAGE